MGLFYAYLRNSDARDEHCRYLVTFVNREAADEWWRMISTPPSPYIGIVKRISPQFYFQCDVNNRDVARFCSNSSLPNAEQFREKMFVSVLSSFHGGPLATTVRPTKITDHISGRWYFIRSKADRWSHWYLRIKGECLVCGNANCDAIHVSSEYRTKFCLRVRNPANDQMPKDFVMIGRDEISIAGPKGYILHINDADDLVATKGYQGETDLVFGDLKDRFIARAEKQVNGEVWEYVELVERGLGEAWELVN